MKRVLSIAGGGMRGVGVLQVLMRLEELAGRPVYRIFDLVGGTSTGGIVACLAGAGRSAGEARAFYRGRGPEIFRRSLARGVRCGFGAWGTKYGNEALVAELKEAVGPGLMRDAVVDVMVTAASRDRREVMVKSWVAEWRDVPLALAALMTSAAPTFFPQVEFPHGGAVQGYLDGGLVRNDPCACVALEAWRRWPGEEIFHLALGTGRPARPRPLPNGGVLAWAAEVFDATTTLDARYDSWTCEAYEELNPRYRHERIDFPLERMPAMDAVDGRTLDEIEEGAAAELMRDWPRAVEIARLLAGSAR